MKLIELYISEVAIVDSRENKLSLINVFENTIAEGFPLLIPRMTITLVFEKEDSESQFDGSIILLINEKTLIEAPISINIAGINRTRSISTINALVIPEPGLFKVQIKSNTDTIKTFSIEFSHKTIISTDQPTGV